ncbi:MAG: 3-hydroxyacyl-CoA dehydrogenase, partial [Bacteroidetes bacterium]|nr:3-hydroxyacyl-CoA dehydrogenase [Bacteroidota bacterium]
MKHISHVAVLGSGTMGSGIACHLANVGLRVLLLDMPNEDASRGNRNYNVEASLQNALKSKPAPLYKKEFAQRISTGNFEDDLEKIASCDWIIEVIVENLDIKNKLFEKVEKYRKEGTIVSSNTSGIPIQLMSKERSEDFQQHFCGTHFFNPPRYLRLLEIIPGPKTQPEVLDKLSQFGDLVLGKETVQAKDTPAFIANRVGVYAMAYIFKAAENLGLPINVVDKLTGPALSRPKTGTFRLGDLVGLDVAKKVLSGMKEHCPEDNQVQALESSKAFDHLISNTWLGNKSGQGFYKKTGEKDENGKSIIHELNLNSLEYEPRQKRSLNSLSQSKQIEDPKRRIQAITKAEDKGGQLLRDSFGALFAYVSKRI